MLFWFALNLIYPFSYSQINIKTKKYRAVQNNHPYDRERGRTGELIQYGILWERGNEFEFSDTVLNGEKRDREVMQCLLCKGELRKGG